MQRRRFLKWASHTLGAACAAVITLPGVRYLFATVNRQDAAGGTVQRVARLADLPVGVPVEAAITGRRRDAWSMYPEEVIGKVWLLRRSGENAADGQADVAAWSAVCPHLRCAVQMDSSKKHFVCPCHRGRFTFDGERLNTNGEHNPANRGLDALPCKTVSDDSGTVWIEVTWQDFEPAISEKRTMS